MMNGILSIMALVITYLITSDRYHKKQYKGLSGKFEDSIKEIEKLKLEIQTLIQKYEHRKS